MVNSGLKSIDIVKTSLLNCDTPRTKFQVHWARRVVVLCQPKQESVEEQEHHHQPFQMK